MSMNSTLMGKSIPEEPAWISSAICTSCAWANSRQGMMISLGVCETMRTILNPILWACTISAFKAAMLSFVVNRRLR